MLKKVRKPFQNENKQGNHPKKLGWRKRGVGVKGGSLHVGFGGFDGFGGSGERLALLLLVLQNTVPRDDRDGFDGFGGCGGFGCDGYPGERKKKHINKKTRKQNFHGSVPGFWGDFVYVFFSPIRNDPKKTQKLNFGTHPVPDNPANLFMFMCSFFSFFVPLYPP